MNKRLLLIISHLVLALILAACSGAQGFSFNETPTPTPDVTALTIAANPDATDGSEGPEINIQAETPEHSAPVPAGAPVRMDAGALIALSHDEKLVAVIQDYAMCAFRADTLALIWCTDAEDNKVHLAGQPVWAADDTQVASFAFTNVTVWDAVTGRIHTIPVPPATQQGSFINTLSWSGCKSPMLVNFSSGSVGLLDPLADTYSGFIDVTGRGIVTSSSTDCESPLVVLDEGGRITFADRTTGRALWALDGVTTVPSWDPERRRFAIGREDGVAIITPGADTSEAVLMSRSPSRVRQVVWSPDGETIASINDGGVTLWDVKSGKAKYRLTSVVKARRVVFNSDGTMFALLDEVAGLSLWDTASGKLLSLTADVQNILFSSLIPDKALIYSAGSLGVMSVK